MSIKEIKEQIKNSQKPVVSIIAKGNNSKLIAIGLGKGVLLKEHTAPGPTKMIILKGQIEYKAIHQSKLLSALDEYQIPMDELHSVVGVEESIFLLSVNN